MSTKPIPAKQEAMTATLAKGLDVLEAVAAREEISLAALARELGMSAPTVYRIAQTLVGRGYLAMPGRGRYQVTLKAWELGAAAARRLGWRDIALAPMRALAERTGEAVHLSVLQGDGIVIVEKIDCPQPVRVDTFTGLRAPLHCSATGKAILAFLPAGDVASLVPEKLERFTKATQTARVGLERELAQVRKQGWAQNKEEWRQGVCAAAVPIHDRAGAVVASLSVTVPTGRFTDKALRGNFVPAMKVAAEAIERAMA